MSLPWFKCHTSTTVAGMIRHAWTHEHPCPAYVAELELQAITANGQRDDWSVRELAARWGWSASTTFRWLRTSEQRLANTWNNTHLEKQGLTPAPETDAEQYRDASHAQLSTREKEKEKENPYSVSQKKNPKASWSPSVGASGLGVLMTDEWLDAPGSRVFSWEVKGPLQRMTRMECLSWWLGEYLPPKGKAPPVTYDAETILGAWKVYLSQSWARETGRGITTFMRLDQLPKWTEAGGEATTPKEAQKAAKDTLFEKYLRGELDDPSGDTTNHTGRVIHLNLGENR